MDPQRDRIVEIAAVRVKAGRAEVFCTLVNPGLEIPPTASAIHHITDEMVAGAPRFDEVRDQLLEFLGESVPVAFNAPFDASMISPGLGWSTDETGPRTGHWICALRAARHLWQDAPGFSNQALRYLFKASPSELLETLVFSDGLQTSGGLAAHRALDDVLVSLGTFRRALADMHVNHGISSLEEVKVFTDRPVPITTLHFGAHAGKALAEVPAGYLNWLLHDATGIDWDLRLAVQNEVDARRMATTGAGNEPGRHESVIEPWIGRQLERLASDVAKATHRNPKRIGPPQGQAPVRKRFLTTK